MGQYAAKQAVNYNALGTWAACSTFSHKLYPESRHRGRDPQPISAAWLSAYGGPTDEKSKGRSLGTSWL